jgi:hypothetical protein
MMWYSLGELERSACRLTRALALADDTGETDIVAQAEHLLGHVEHGLGNASAARDRFARRVEGFRALGIPWGLGNSLNGMAKVARGERRYRPRRSVCSTRPPRSFATVRGSWRWCCIVAPSWPVQRGNPDEAIALVRDSLALFRPLHDKYAILYVMVPFAAARRNSRVRTSGRRGFWALATR